MEQHEVISIEEYLNKRRKQKEAKERENQLRSEKGMRESKERMKMTYYEMARLEASFS